MTLAVSNLSKSYGSHLGVDGVSFRARKGRVLGLLGPNGAGKSTTLKILSGYMKPDSGTATLGSLEIERDALKIKNILGYLPENNPLYPDMYVREFLAFTSNVFRLKNSDSAMDRAIHLTGLESVCKKKISQLSKGYRQRVGLAQAIIHDPQFLILDEPTSGLDPNQLEEIRTLIKVLGRDRIVIFSTHIMQEVKAICRDVVILNKGKVIFDDTLEKLTTEAGKPFLLVEFEKPLEPALIGQIIGVSEVLPSSDKRFKIVISSGSDIRGDVFDLAVQHSNRICEMRTENGEIEEIFKELTS